MVITYYRHHARGPGMSTYEHTCVPLPGEDASVPRGPCAACYSAQSLRQVAREHGIHTTGEDIDVLTGKRVHPE
jgi:hypothetical protein